MALPVRRQKFILRGEPTLHRHTTKFQGVLKAYLDHLDHQLIFVFLLELFAGQAVVPNRLFYQCKCQRNRGILAVAQQIVRVQLQFRIFYPYKLSKLAAA